MADNNIDEFVIQVKLETDKLQKDFAKLSEGMKKSADDVQSKFDKAFNPDKLQKNLARNTDLIKTATLNIGKILTGGLAGLGATLGAKFAIDFIRNMTSNAHGMEFLAKSTGTSPKQVQLLQEVYKRMGGSPNDANQQIAQLHAQLVSGNLPQQLASSLGRLGIKVQGGNKDPVAIILEALHKLGDQKYSSVQRGQISQGMGLDFYGEYAGKNPKLLQKYIKEVEKELTNNKDNAQLAELDRKFQDLDQRWKKIQTTLLTGIVPALETFTKIVEGILHPINTSKEITKDLKVTKGKGFTESLTNTPSYKDALKTLFSSNSYKITKPTSTDITAKSIKNKPTTTLEWDRIKSGIAFAETSGGKASQIAKADKMGAYGTYGLRLSTAKDQLNYEGKKSEAKSLTVDMLRANNYQLADQIAQRYFERFQKAYGTERAIKKYHGNTNQHINQLYLNKVNNAIPMMQQSVQSKNTAINNHHQVSYNMDNVHLHNVDNPKQFVNEMDMLRNTAFNSSRNQLA